MYYHYGKWREVVLFSEVLLLSVYRNCVRYLTFVLVDVTVEEPIEAIGDNDGYSSDCNDHTHCNTDP